MDNQHQVYNPGAAYQFGGYAPPLISLDETGPAYWVSTIHPYYKNQPEYWSTRAIRDHPATINVKNVPINRELYPQFFGNEIQGYDPSIMTQGQSQNSKLYTMLTF